LATLLQAFARIRRARPRMKLAIVGSGPILELLQAEARSLGILEDCIFQPATNHVAAWLNAMDIFVLPSQSEDLSNSLIDAMACGCCAVASNVGGNPELVQHEQTGLLFEAGDVPALSAALEILIGNAQLRKRLAAGAAVRIRERFSIQASAERMEEI